MMLQHPEHFIADGAVVCLVNPGGQRHRHYVKLRIGLVAAVVYKEARASLASGGSDTQQNQATSGRRASGSIMLTRPPDAGLGTHRSCCQTKSFGPRLEIRTMLPKEHIW